MPHYCSVGGRSWLSEGGYQTHSGSDTDSHTFPGCCLDLGDPEKKEIDYHNKIGWEIFPW